MSRIDESQLAKMDVEERFRFRRLCADNRDIESLLVIAKYRFIKGSTGTNESNLPEMCYYYGRLHRVEELGEFLKEKNHYLFMLSKSCKELAQNLLNIGVKFPYLNEGEISFLEERYCNSKTFELFDIIMFDCDLLPRPIKKFDKESLNKSNTEFSRDFIMQIYDCFSKNKGFDNGYSQLYVYNRIQNRIVRMKYEDIGLGEYCVIQPIFSNELWNLMMEKFGEKCADSFVKRLSVDEDWEDLKNSDFYLLDIDEIEDLAVQYFNDSSKVEDLKAEVALFWLKKMNSIKIDLI